METFYISHAYLMEHFHAPVRRSLMDTIDWSYRLIGIKGPRGVGRTSFLLQYAKENFDVQLRQCLYINLNSFYFQAHGIVDFAGRFVEEGGQVLLIDQAFKLPDWREQLVECYHKYPYLRIVYTTTSVNPGEDEDNSELSSLSRTYVLHGFSFREYINLVAGTNFRPYSYEQIITNHQQIATEISSVIKPLSYFKDYIHHGFYPFFLEKKNYSEMLIKNMNTMLEVDILFLKEIELSYLPKLKKLLHILAQEAPCSPNVSLLAKSIETSRATVVNYLSYLKEARLINMLYSVDEQFPKKPAVVYMHNTNILYPTCLNEVEPRQLRETFFYNMLHKDNRLNKSNERNVQFLINQRDRFRVCDWVVRTKNNPEYYYAIDNLEIGHDNVIPLWLFGFLY